jgi:hypothetical protein
MLLVVSRLVVSGSAYAQTDVALSASGAFTGATASLNNGNETQGATSSGGGMLEFRHIRSGLVGFEGTYSLQRANQLFTYTGPYPVIPVCVPGPCSPPSNPIPAMTSVSAMTHELSGDWIVSDPIKKSVRLFALAGVGVRITVPGSGPSGSQIATSVTPSYIYGFGTDWAFLPHFGLRVQYRGDIHKVPEVAKALVLPYSTSPVPPGSPTPLTTPDSVEHDAEPMVGVYYRF